MTDDNILYSFPGELARSTTDTKNSRTEVLHSRNQVRSEKLAEKHFQVAVVAPVIMLDSSDSIKKSSSVARDFNCLPREAIVFWHSENL